MGGSHMLQELIAALRGIQQGLTDVQSEDELEKLFLSQGLYYAIGYTHIGRDIRAKRRSTSGIPDVFLLNEDESVQAVIEFKRPGEELNGHSDQLLAYANELRPQYALLTNGQAFWLYNRQARDWRLLGQYALDDIVEDPTILLPLAKETLDLRSPDHVLARLNLPKDDLIPLTDPDREGGRQFIHAFGLSKENGEPARDLGELGVFGWLVFRTYRLARALEGRSRFFDGAFSFWKKVYARKLEKDKVPKTWEVFGATGNELLRLMFALETAYTLTARLILAKAVQDHGGAKVLTPLSELFAHELRSPEYLRSRAIPAEAYPKAVAQAFGHYAEHFLTSLYASDIFDWWREGTDESEDAREFGKAVGRVSLALFRFDFSALEGDFLGELYQSYFDPETRKALGEFYTPPAVVDFILDEVDYQGEGRLLDPACGSGTFLIRALRRFLEKERAKGSSAASILRKLTEDYAIVGFDINPFAVLMSQVNLASQLVGVYIKALEEEPELALRHLPVVQTDSLRQEVFEGEALERSGQPGLDFQEEELVLMVPVPIRTTGKRAPVAEVRFPNPERAIGAGQFRNFSEWILALEALFDALYRANLDWERSLDLRSWDYYLTKALERLGFERARIINTAPHLASYAGSLWGTLQELREKHGDGRFLKSLGDFALGMVLKHVIRYRYVVGNPPYVRIQSLPEFQKASWVNQYIWVEGSFDIFIPFLERAFLNDRSRRPGWLEEGGRLGYITPNRYMNANYAAALREELPKRARVLSVTDLGAVTFEPPEADQATRLFREAMVYPAITILKNQPPEGSYVFPAARLLPKAVPASPETALKSVREGFTALGKTGYSTLLLEGEDSGDVFLASSDWLTARGWFLMPPTERSVWEKLDAVGKQTDHTLRPREDTGGDIPNNVRRLVNYTTTRSGGFQGISTALDKVMVLRQVDEDPEKGLLYLTPRGGGETVAIEKEVLRPFLFGTDIDRWRINWQGWWVVFPYWYGVVSDESDGGGLGIAKWHLIPSTENLDYKRSRREGRGMRTFQPFEHWPQDAPVLDRDYPHLWRYLKAHEGELRAREGGRFNPGNKDEWRWYGLAYPRSLEAITIVPKILLQTAASIPEVAVDSVGYFFAGSGTHNVYGMVLSKRLSPFFVASILNSNVADYYAKQTSAVFSGGYYSYGDQFVKWLPIPRVDTDVHQHLSGLANELTRLAQAIAETEDKLANFPTSLTESLAQQGKAPSRDALGNLAAANGLAQELSIEKTTMQTDLMGQFVLRLGRGSLTTDSKALAQLVLEVLRERGKIKRDELLALNFPINPHDQEAYLDQLSNWREERARLEGTIETLEQQVNKEVYALFELRPDEIQTIEAYLARFLGGNA